MNVLRFAGRSLNPSCFLTEFTYTKRFIIFSNIKKISKIKQNENNSNGKANYSESH